MGRVVLFGGAIGALVAVIANGAQAGSAASRTWPPFVLVVGLLLIGDVAHRDGLFGFAATVAGRMRGRSLVLLVALLGLVAVTTAVLNLDTSVAFLTPVLVLAARRRGISEEPFLYGSLFMANSASLLLPGSNLTNLLVLAPEHLSGSVFAARMAPAWLAAIIVTVAVLTLRFRRQLAGPVDAPDSVAAELSGPVGATATVTGAVLVVGLPSPAIAVLGVGLAAILLEASRGRLRVHEVAAGLGLPVLIGVFLMAVALGTLAGVWSGPAGLMRSASSWETSAIGALGAVAVNNLPAAVLLSARVPAHPRALLIGLDLGPNLAVTGSLSALLWFKAATTVGARPSVLRVSRIGVVLVPCSLVAALGASAILSPTGL